MAKDRGYLDTERGLRETMETRWRPMWKAMGHREVAGQVMARRGPAVDDGGWGPHKIAEAEVWVREELEEAEKEKVHTRWLAVLALLIASASAAFTGWNLYLNWIK